MNEKGKSKKVLVPRTEAIVIKDICQSNQATYTAWLNGDGSGSVDVVDAVMNDIPVEQEVFGELQNAYSWLGANGIKIIANHSRCHDIRCTNDLYPH